MASFFKIMIGDFTNTLRLPVAFTKRLETKLDTKAILEDPTGGTWVVTLKKTETNLFFQCGWPRFVKYNFIEFGDLLVFTYAGYSIFNVKIYDKTGCEKNLSLAKKSSVTEQEKDSGKKRNRGRVEGKKKNALAIVLREDLLSNNGHTYTTLTKRVKRKANRQIDPRNYARNLRSETSSFDDSEELSLEGACHVPEKHVMVDLEDQQTTKRRNGGDECHFIVGSSTIKRRKSTSGKDSPFEKQRRSKSERHLNQRETGELSKRNKLIQCERAESDVSMDSENEVISVYSNTESEDVVNSLDASVPSCDDMVDDFSGRNLAYSIDEEVKSRDLEIGCGSEELLDHQGNEFESENPFCRVVMGETYITKAFMNLPCKFVRSFTRTSFNDRRIKRKLNVRLLVSDGRMWLVTLTCRRNKAYFSTGWGKFVEENKLREGEICFFEMIKRGTLDIKVSRCEATVTPARPAVRLLHGTASHLSNKFTEGVNDEKEARHALQFERSVRPGDKLCPFPVFGFKRGSKCREHGTEEQK
ncbi:hypothetical protein IFM89_011887 [Coptis chinensis]|uniref:TF-B3 domain-containing protein n=1 Tax=Coptis chinensis TaxID=261450 RepID=A0A835I1E7_9MAGN|nr:hypothetical protein IFM89_011887 [Coptis chinensis]